MQADFWHRRWAKKEISFHEGETNQLLATHLEKLNLLEGQRVFLPLCGKTRDFAWLLDRGFQVSGAELSELAIEELFAELSLTPEITQLDQLIHYHADNIDIFVGDIFALNAELLGHVDAVYDRAALVALPADMREQYAAHVIDISAAAPQLLITFEYDQSVIEGPPFSIAEPAVQQYYANTYQISLAQKKVVAGKLKGVVDAEETAWILQANKQ